MVVPLDIANAFIQQSAGSFPVDHMKLQKLSYYTYGWWLGFKGTPLTVEKPQVWRYGPVFKSIYSRLADYRSLDIHEQIKPAPFSSHAYGLSVESDEAVLASWIWERYGRSSATELSRETHLPGTPWDTIAKKHDYKVPLYLEMDDRIVKRYFEDQAQSEGLVWTQG